MTGYRPDRWTIVSVQDSAGIWFDKVFGTWSGGYLHGSSWRLNSGIVSHEIEGDVISFYGESGSVYHCHRDAYGVGGAENYGVLASIKDKFSDRVRILEEEEALLKYGANVRGSEVPESQ